MIEGDSGEGKNTATDFATNSTKRSKIKFIYKEMHNYSVLNIIYISN